MHLIRLFISAGALLASLSAAQAAPVTYDGVTFPEGDISFADAVVDLTFGIPAPTDPDFIDGNAALGAPDFDTNSAGSVSLGSGGSITLRFTDNALTGSGPGNDIDDLHIFEIGPDVEDTFVAISKDGVNFSGIGKVFGSTASIDIDDFGFGTNDLFYFVRLTDDPNEGNNSGPTVGADIDAVGAISTVRTPAVPLPATAWMLLAGVGGLSIVRRRKRV